MNEIQNILKILDENLDISVNINKLPENQHQLIFNRLKQYLVGSWINYEDYMLARLIQCNEGGTGLLLVRFKANTGLNELGIHSHDYSHRQILVLEGEGEFHYIDKFDKHLVVKVSEGGLIQFSKKTKHTFTTNDKEMLVLSIHRPYISLEDESNLTKH